MSIRTREVRELAIQTYQQGGRSLKAVAEIFKIHYQTLRNWLKIDKAGGEQIPRQRGHRSTVLQADDLTRIKSYVLKNPSTTCAQIKVDLSLSCCISTISVALRKMNFSRKKKHYIQLSKKDRM